MRSFPYFCAALAGLLATAAPHSLLAQQTPVSLEVRGSVQGDFIRIVFSGSDLPDVAFDESQAGSLKMTFNRAVALTGDTALSGITPAPVLKQDGATVTVSVPGLERQRNVKIGQRLLVDLFTQTPPSQGEAAAAPEPTPEPTPEPEPKPVAESAPTPEPAPVAEPAPVQVAEPTSLVQDDAAAPVAADNVPIIVTTPASKPEPETMPVAEAIAAAAAPVPAVEVTAMPVTPAPVKVAEPGAAFTGTATVTVGSTQGVSIAAFVRQGYLWIVTSREILGVPPLVSGPSAAMLGKVDAIKVDGGSAYRLKLPQGAYVRPEGGGLVWRLIVEDKDPGLKGVPADRDFAESASGPQMNVPLAGATGVLRLPDPVIGDDLAVVLVGRAGSRLRNSDSYVDFDLIPSIVGAVIRPKADGLSIAVLPQKVTISRQGGLRMSAAGPTTGEPVRSAAAAEKKPADGKYVPTRMYDFKNWGLGGEANYLPMRRSIDERVATAEEDSKLPEIIAGAKFMLAQGLPQEATGFMQMALNFMPLLRESAEFQSIRGGVLALGGQAEEALAALQTPGLETNEEIALWKAYALARDNKFSEAQKMLPKPAVQPLIASYPPRIQAMILPAIIETVLSRGDVNLADSLIDMYDETTDGQIFQDRDQITAYYKGRAATLRGNYEAASEFFREASEGMTGPYPVRATLMLVERGLSSKTIGRDDAIRKLERFRFGWRGDALESEVLEKLGMIYVTGGEQRRGLSILRGAAGMAQSAEDRDNLVAVMQKAFRELFSGKTKEKMSAMESAAVASEFAELMPAGGEGELITLNIADQMVAVDLLDRAADMIEPMVERTEKLPDAMHYAEKAAGIRILDRRPEEALRVIDKALSRPDALAEKQLPAKEIRALALLRARAKADLKRTDDAFAELRALPEAEDNLRLMADTAWKAQRWTVAAEAFGKLIKLANLDAMRPPTKEQAQMILNRALALSLSGNEAELSAFSNAYGDIMRRTDLYRPFQLVSRTAREAQLADRETLLKLVSEVDLFTDVLESYKTNNLTPSTVKPGQTDQKEKAPEKPAADAKPAVETATETAKDAAADAAKPADEKPAAKVEEKH